MFTGSMVALVTPMKADTSLDWDGLHKLVDWHIEQGTHAIVAVGTTGESATLNMTEHADVIRAVVDQVNGRVPVIAGTGANSTSEALELTEGAKEAKADACLLVTPYYNKPSQEGLYLHHKYIAERVAIPQLLYNVPGRTAVDMLPDTVSRLSEVPNIIGIKDATGDIERLKQMRAVTADDFVFLSGDDATALEFMVNGGCGEISVTANVFPDLCSRMCELLLEGDVEAAREIDTALSALNSALFLEANPIPVKWAVSKLGFMSNTLRLPLTPLAEEHHAKLAAAMEKAKSAVAA